MKVAAGLSGEEGSIGEGEGYSPEEITNSFKAFRAINADTRGAMGGLFEAGIEENI